MRNFPTNVSSDTAAMIAGLTICKYIFLIALLFVWLPFFGFPALWTFMDKLAIVVGSNV